MSSSNNNTIINIINFNNNDNNNNNDNLQVLLFLVLIAPVVIIVLFIGFCIIRKKTKTEVKKVRKVKKQPSNNNNEEVQAFTATTYPHNSNNNNTDNNNNINNNLPQTSTNTPGYDITGNDLFNTKASLPKLSLPSISDVAGINSRYNATYQSSLAPEPKNLLPDTPPSILITNTDSPSFNLAHQKFVSAPVVHPLAVPNTDIVMATLLGDIFLSKVTRTVELGSNSAGTIYKGVWQGAHVVLRPILTDKLRQLRDDIVILKNLRHPNIVIFFGLFQMAGEQEINVVTEFVEHGNLKEFLKSHNPDYIYKQQSVLFQQKKEAQQIRKEHQEILQPSSHFTISTAEFEQQKKALKEAQIKAANGLTARYVRTSGLPHSYSQSDLSTMYHDLPDSIFSSSSSSSSSVLTSRDLVKLSRDIAAGMMQLEQKSFAHRHLSAGSIVVGGSLPGNLRAKLSDFGLTRHTQFVPSPRWTSPEALQSKRYTIRSDLWSYGITLYEIFTYGRQPYDNLADAEILNWVLEGNRLPFSSATPPIIQTIACWDLNLAKRPTFDEIFELLDNYLQSPYFK